MRVLLFILSLNIFLFSLEINLSKKDLNIIANKIWQNEGAGKKSYLVWWNKGEEFASLGIGHFIWFTKDKPMWFFHAFPAMLKYIIKEGAKPPKWLTPNSYCVWNSYKEWKEAKIKNTKRMRELTDFLYKTKDLQAKFMLKRLVDAYPKLLNYAKSKKLKRLIAYNFNRLLYKKDGTIDPQGAYILIDYINFKGDGVLESERYQGKGWGLFQVLKYMDPYKNKYRAFRDSARYILDRLIKIAPKERRLWRFRRGWFKRLDTYIP
ncbi:MAG: hypothetical protein GXO02_04760 [Epsilonproteobacteria bacterium]|nr:hypothetical protein [Campylobacterota bacterium]